MNHQPSTQKYFIYLISDYTRRNLHPGVCTDLEQTLACYAELSAMSLHYPAANCLNRLVYLEWLTREDQARERLAHFTALTLAEKTALVIEVNPEWMDLTMAGNWDFKF